MRIDEAEARLHDLLRGAGVDVDRPTLAETWDAFVGFAAEPVDSASDGILVQGGVFSFSGSPRYYLDFLRQFEVLDDGEHDHFEQLHCEFQFEPDHELRSLGTFAEWWWPNGDRPFEVFASEMRSRPEFEAAIQREPSAASVSQELV